ncbi:MAG: hypothetical protein LBQ70_06855 [Prevotellaceae bacterium]|nr:hypothetical protein [Prevotellaceae bacterium]
MNTKERLRKFAAYKGAGRNRFEESVGISLGYLSSRSPSVGSEIIEKIANCYPDLNVEWLITGRGQMIKNPCRQELEAAAYACKQPVYAPLISRHAQAEYLNRLDDRAYLDTLPALPVIPESGGKRSYMCFEVRGDGMNDGTDSSYTPGDILICRETEAVSRQRKLLFGKGKTFVIVHEKEGIIINRIADCEEETGLVRLHPANPLYEDSLIFMPNIKKLFEILKLQRIIAHSG